MNARYLAALHSIPAPGGGCHVALLSVANLGILADRDPEEVFQDIRRSIPAGTRRVPDKEIHDAIRKALQDHTSCSFTSQPRPQPAVRDGRGTLRRIIAQARIRTEADLWEASPIRLMEAPEHDPVLLFETLYRPDDLLWIGDRHEAGILGQTLRPAAEWIRYFREGGATAPHILPNPLTGTAAPTKTGEKQTLRGDGCVAAYRFALAEFDELSRDEQICFWAGARLPIVALIHSGGKSIHAWLDVSKLADVKTPEQWGDRIKGTLYDRLLVPLGVDRACSNPSRLSRLPGHFRKDKWQRILWLSAEGKSLC